MRFGGDGAETGPACGRRVSIINGENIEGFVDDYSTSLLAFEILVLVQLSNDLCRLHDGL